MAYHKRFPVFRTQSNWLLVVIVFLIVAGSINRTNGIVYRRDSSSESESYRNSRIIESRENEIGRSTSSSSEAESSIPTYSYFARGGGQSERYSEGGGVLFDNSNENLRYNDYNSLNTVQEKEEKVKWKGWNYFDTSKGWAPHETKTVSFQFLDDDGRYAHAPPSWPHDEYMIQFGHPYAPQGHGFGLRNASEAANGGSINGGTTGGTGTSNHFTENNEATKLYEWQKLHARPNHSLRKGHFIGPGFYDYGSTTPTLAYNPYYTHQGIIDGSGTSGITSSSASSSSSSGGVGDAGDEQIPNAVSESATHGKLFGGGGGYGGLSPYDYYRRKRLRLKIHPGLLVAPIAGFAAYKAVSAIASKPLLFELGWVGNKPNIDVGGGWGWPQPRPPYPYYPPIAQIPNPYLPPVHPVHIPHGHGQGGQQLVPILRPRKKPADSHRSSWWNPFAALTPRFMSSINKKDDRSGVEGENELYDQKSTSPDGQTTEADFATDDGNWYERP